MEHRHVGHSGLMVSEIAYGNWLTHGQQIDEESAFACVGAALDAGITTFDTADMYADTRAEEVLGRALAPQRRAGLEISTKVYWPTGPGPNDRGLSRKHMLDSIDGSLRRLRTDYVDIYWAHQYDVETPLEETMEAFHDIVRSGKARYIGVSEWPAEDIRAAHRLARELRIPLIANQPQYSMLWRVIESEVIPTCAELGIGQIVWSPIAQGVLTGKYLPGKQPPSGSRGADAEGRQWLDPFMRDEVLSRVQRLRPLADGLGLTLAQLAVAWTLQNPHVASAIVGASHPKQLIENVAVAGLTLDQEVRAQIDAILDPVVERDPARTARQEPRP
ncbi:aldo/keto reductase family protein [Streptomyces sp. NPDC093589]|uniref:aldo/keto reductase family protein n=1 Tax=Streptomyces sp. NPDC093589 TaxID=3366043 RepID=UPI0037F1F023